MLKDFVFVGLGSFLGGGCRFLVSRWSQALFSFPYLSGTFFVNIVGCFFIGILSVIPLHTDFFNPRIKLILTTGFCGGFTTFSTFMLENSAFLKEHNTYFLLLYVVASLTVGFLALISGQQLAKLFI